MDGVNCRSVTAVRLLAWSVCGTVGSTLYRTTRATGLRLTAVVRHTPPNTKRN